MHAKKPWCKVAFGSPNLLQQSEKVCFFHDPEELFLIHFTITIAVCFVYHFLQLLIRHPFTEFFCHTLQILKRDLACFVIIKKPECLQDFILRVTVQYFVCHHLQKLLIPYCTTSVIIN